MTAALLSSLILASSLIVFFVGFRSSCRLILRKGLEPAHPGEAGETARMEFLAVRQALADYPHRSGDSGPILEAMEQDYRALTYLLRKTASPPASGYLCAQRLLMVDFQLLRLWVRLKRMLAVTKWCPSLQEMEAILEYFGTALGQRLCPAVGLFPPPMAAPGTSPGLPLGICSYCKHVRFPAGSSTGDWVTVEKYHQLGGEEFVVLSHGICPQCYENIVKPLLPRG